MRCAASTWVSPRSRMALAISVVSPDLICSFSALGRPRSANTLPELASISIPATMRLVIFQLLRDDGGGLQALMNDVHIWLRRFNTAFALLLKRSEEHKSDLKSLMPI